MDSLEGSRRHGKRGGEGANFGVIETKKFLRRRAGNDPAGFEQNNARGQQQSFVQIVRYENDRFAEALGQGAEFALEFGASNGVERAERFVHQENWRIGSESAGDPDALALAAGKFARAAGGKFRRIKSDESQELPDANGRAAAVPLFERGNETNIFSNRKMRKEAGVLNDVADATAEPYGVPSGSGAAVDQNFPVRRKKHSIDEPEQGGLAAAAAAEEDEGFSLRDF